MNKKCKISVYSIMFILCLSLVVSLFVGIASSGDVPENPSIGYEFLDDGEVVHIWNNATMGDYYFNKSSGMQFSNHYQDYWTHNVFCLSYYNNGEWIYDCNDALSSTWSIDTDNETYVNITDWRDKIVGTETVRLGLRYHLKLNDENLSIIVSVENLGNSPIANELGFVWRMKDIQINGDEEDDTIFINGSYYDLHSNETIDLSFTNLNESYFKLEDSWFVRLDWNNSLKYKVEVKNGTDYNAHVTLGINTGTLDAGQTKYTTLYWQDPPVGPAWTSNLSDDPDPVNVGNAITYAGTANDNGGNATDPYYLIVCDSNGITENDPSPGGTCTGNLLCQNSSTLFDTEATCDYTTVIGDVGIKTAYGFLCGADGLCSASTSTTTAVNITYGWLNVSIQKPDDDSDWYEGDTNLTINATVTCVGGECGNVSALARYNLSASVDTAINTTDGANPFYVIGGWNLSTAVYDNINISTQDSLPSDLFFKPDGTKLYEVGYDGDLFYQSTCSDAWNLSSCIYDNINISTQDGIPTDLFFKPDGTKLYEVGYVNSLFHQYTCSDAWNLSSCIYDNINISTQDTSPNGLFFKPDGTKLYEIGYSNNLMYQYTCSDAWNLSSCIYDNINISTQDTSPNGLFFKPDGTKLYEMGSFGDLFYQSTCSDAWNLSSCSYDNVNFSTQDTIPEGFFFKPDGTRLYEIGDTANLIYQYSLEDGTENLQTQSLSQGESFNVLWSLNVTSNITESYLLDVLFNSTSYPDNITANNTADRLVNLNPPITYGWLNVSIQKPDDDSDWYEGDTNLTINATVTCVGGECGNVSALARYNLSASVDTAINTTDGANPFYIKLIGDWNLSTATYDEVSISTQDAIPSGFFFKPDGTKLYEIGDSNNLMYQYTCSDAWNLSSCIYDNINISTQDNSPTDLFFKPDGTKLYESGSIDYLMYQSTCSDAWNLSSCIYDNVNISVQRYSSMFFFKPDGTKLYEMGSLGDLMYQSTCSDAWNLSSCSYDNVNISTQDTSPNGLFFKPDGTKLYEIGSNIDLFYQSTCSDAWNLSSCSYDNVNISTQDTIPKNLFFKPDGTKLYEIGGNIDLFYQYSLESGVGNLETSSATLSKGESWNVSWTLNVTTASEVDYLIDVLFNSTSYPTDITANNTADRLVNLNPDRVPPISTIIMTSPPDGANYTNDTWTSDNIKVTITGYDAIGFDNISYPKYCNDSINTCTPDTPIGDGVTISTEGISYIRYFTNDSAGNAEDVKSRTLKIDTTEPSISIISPTNNTNSTDTGLDINYSVTDTNLDSCWWTNNSGVTNYTLTGCVNITDVTWNEGTTSLLIYTNDSIGNKNSIDLTFFIDSIDPVVDIDHPRPQTYSYNESLTLNYTTADTNIESCWYKVVNSTGYETISNTTLTNCLNTTFDVPRSDTYTLTLYSNDSLGNENSDTVIFESSLESPSIVLDYPTDNLWLTEKNNVYFNFTVTDSDGIDTCELWTNSTGTWHKNVTFTGVVSGTQNWTQISLSETSGYIWNVWCNDTTGLEDWALNNFTFNVDTINPLIEYSTGTENNNTNTTDTFIYVNISASDTNENNIVFRLFNQTSQVNSTTYTSNEREINWTDLPDEIYTYNVTITDDADRSNTTGLRTITLDYTAPTISIDEPKAQNYANNNSMELNYTVSDNLIGVDTCWYKAVSSTGYIQISNTTIIDCLNTTFSLPGGDVNYNLTLYANDSLGNENSEKVTFGIRTVAPVIVLSPPNNTHSNRLTNHYFNFTITTNADSIDTCQLWGNFNGTWLLNQTLTSPVYDGSNNNFTAINLTERDFYWNVWCNDSLDNNGWALNNNTFTTDITNPNIILDTPATTSGSQTISFTNTVNDTNLDSCKYSIFNSTGQIDGTNENVSFTCGSSTSATVTAYSTYNLTIYAVDLASNENSSTKSFTTSPAEDGGGGGGGEDIEKIPTIALQEIIGERVYDELERAIFYARINTFCSIQQASQTLAIQDFSGECSLKRSDIEIISNEISQEGFIVSVNDLILFYDKYNSGDLEQVFMTSEIIEVNELFTSVLGITNPMRVNPPRLDRPFVVTDVDGNITIEQIFVVNKEVKECLIIFGDFECEVITDNSVKMILNINDTDFFDKIFHGEMSITSDADPENLEIKRIDLFPRVYNLSHKIIGIPAIVLLIILGVLILIFAVFFIVREKIRKKLKGRRS